MKKLIFILIVIWFSLAAFTPAQADISWAVSDLFSLNTAFDEHRSWAVSDLFSLNTAFDEHRSFALSDLFSLNTAFDEHRSFALSDLFSLNTAFDEHRSFALSDLFSLNTAFDEHRSFALSDLFSLNTAFDEHRWSALSEWFALNTAFQPDDRLVWSFEEGWNMVSLNVTPHEEFWAREEGPDVVRLMDPLRDEDGLLVRLVKDRDGRFYAPAYGYCGIPYWNLTQGYQVAVTAAIPSLTVYGDPIAADADIPLRPNWNLAAYFPTYELDASAPDFYVVSPIREQLLGAKNNDGQFLSPAWNFSNMPPWQEGQGYQIKMSQAATLNYPPEEEGQLLASAGESDQPIHSSKKKSTQTAVQTTQTTESKNHWPEPAMTGANFSLLITAFQGRNVPDGAQAAALDPAGKVIGLGLVQEGRCGLAVWGDDESTEPVEGLKKGEEFEVRLWDAKLSREIKLIPAMVQDGAGLVYEKDGFTALTLADAQAIPEEYFLAEAYPNPFNAVVRLSYGLPEKAQVKIRVYDPQGRLTATLVDAEQNAGYHTAMWKGVEVPSGAYFVKMEAGKFNASKKVTLVK